MTNAHFKRRLFLQGVGGAVVAAPFLGSYGFKEARAQTDAPKRLIVFFTHYGCLTNRWFPDTAHGPLSTASFAGKTTEPLGAYADKLLMPRGIRAMNEWSFGQRLGQETDPHTQVMNAMFTGCPSDGWSDLVIGAKPDIRADVPARKLNCRPVGVPGKNIGRSLDHIAAEQISPGKTPLMIGVGGAQQGEMQNFSFSKAGAAVSSNNADRAELYTAVGSAATLYNDIANMFGKGGEPTEVTYKIARGKNLLDVVAEDLKRIKAANLSLSDKDKLEAWERLLVDTGGMVSASCTDAVLTDLSITEAEFQNAMGIGPSSKAFMNLAALSAVCDHNRVIFMKYPGTANLSSVVEDLSGDTHGISHRIGSPDMGGANCVSGVNEMIARIDAWYAGQFAYLVGQLDAVPEGEGTLLDNTATVWIQEMSDGNSHNLNNLPIIQAGSCGGYFKTGQAINVDDGQSTLTAGTSEAQCANGGELSRDEAVLDSTGTPSEFANAPLNKYLCNLMNAVGVKADASGFPTIGGDQKVSHFGYYDDTTAFSTFLSSQPADPQITDPGEFAELLASS